MRYVLFKKTDVIVQKVSWKTIWFCLF